MYIIIIVLNKTVLEVYSGIKLKIRKLAYRKSVQNMYEKYIMDIFS